MKAGKIAVRILRILGGIFTGIITLISVVALIAVPVASSMFSQTMNVFFGHKDYKITNSSNTQYFKSSYSSTEALISHEEDMCETILEEGIVLLKNEEGALPLAKDSKISVFGQDSVDLVYGGSGAGSVDTKAAIRLDKALEGAGLEINPILWDFYEKGGGSSYRKKVPDAAGNGIFAVNEVPQNAYTQEVKDSYQDYADAAVVMIGRSGGESADLSFDKENKDSAHYLELTQEERELLSQVCREFDKVVVIINSSNAMELQFIDEFDVDACLWIGALGQTGASAVGSVLTGEVNPSGALVDTYAYDALSAPAMRNFGDYTIVNSEVEAGNKYMVYAEGIYVGYRYYETRYEDVILGNESADNYTYHEEVQFPFGYGLSYTDFTWSNYQVKETGNTFEVSVTVKNTGNTAGKDIVQIYMQKPYTEYDMQNQIEKASVELVGFAKTGELAPNETEVIQISVDKEEMKSYDSQGYGTYIVDAGNYYLSAGENAHAAVNNILSAKGKSDKDGMDEAGKADFVYQYIQDNLDAATYAEADTGVQISNQFEEADLRYYDNDFVYLSRSDWEGTWPKTYQDGSWKAPAQFIEKLEISTSESSGGAADESSQNSISKETTNLSAADLIGADYDDERWNDLIGQIPVDRLYEFIRKGGYATIPLEEINLPGTLDKDGPAGISSTLMGGVGCMAYPPEVVLASTWNVELVEEMGRLVGEDSLYSGVSVWYAPAMNTHRSAFSGRNFEYYSEDGFLSGKMGAAEVRGTMEKGVVVTLKHFAVNDQETNRVGGAMMANEQTIRELHLRAFEITVREGKANGMMTSMNRIGPRWSGGHKGLMTEVLRNEWGFNGFALTDQASFPSFNYCDIYEGLEAGTDLWLNVASFMWKPDGEKMTPVVEEQLKEAAHRVIYTIVNSNAMNGMSEDAEIKLVTPAWKYWRIGLMVLLVLWIGVWGLMTKRLWFGRGKGKKQEKNNLIS